MYIAILGRQPELSVAELERVYDSANVDWFSNETATVTTDTFDIGRLGGTLKAGRIVTELPSGRWHDASQKIVRHYTDTWQSSEGKITLGISAYGFDASSREVQKPGIVLKQVLKKAGVSLRLIPNAEPRLNTAASHHNKLGLSPNKVELLVVRGKSGRIVIAESTGAQNITALARRDQGRPKRDAFVGMLPPKLAQIMINLAGPADTATKPLRLLDPFCGTGVILQEAALMGYSVYGTDLSDKMIDYTRANLDWLAQSHHLTISSTVRQADAMDARWQSPIDMVVAETYLGQPFSAPPSPAKLEEVKRNVNHILSTFLRNLGPQLEPGTPLCLAIPAWRGKDGHITRLPLSGYLTELGYGRVPLKNVDTDGLMYYREDQVVARELLTLVRA